MIQHPESTLHEDQVGAAYRDLLITLARDEPEALERVARTLAGGAAPQALVVSPGAQLAGSYLGFVGNHANLEAPEGSQVFTFIYPAHVAFQVVGGEERAARRLTRRSIAAMLESDLPIAAISGPLPTEPTIANVDVWLGSTTGEKDELTLEQVD
jgi:hypothetical protein